MRRALVVALVVAVIVAMSAWLRSRAGSASGDGPVEFLSGNESTATSAYQGDLGQQMVFGATVVTNTGEQDAVLTDASLVGEVDGSAARIIEVRALDPRTRNMELIGAGPWPFEDYGEKSQPLDRYTLAPAADAELLFVIEVTEPGAWHWPETRVEYTVDGHEYQASTRHGFMACAPSTQACE